MTATTKSKPIPKPTVEASLIRANLRRTDVLLKPQKSACHSPKINIRDRCKACVNKKREGCRFQSIRAFTADDKEVPHFANFDGPDAVVKYKVPKKTGQASHREAVLQTICKALTKLIKDDARQIAKHDSPLIRRRAPFANMRHVCDSCLTSIFNLHYMCSICALDLCVDCYSKNWKLKPNAHLNRCSYRRIHTREHMVPVVKYQAATLKMLEKQCDDMEPINSPDPVTDQSEFLTTDASSITLETFRHCWQQGKPVVVTNVMGEKSRMLWSPSTFLENHGGATTEVIDCKTRAVNESSVKTFFEAYIDPSLRPGYADGAPAVLKIKDWPPKENFELRFPDLYHDFMEMLPIKEYCTVDGYFNLSNRLPVEYLPPDLGPKMFIAYGASEGEQGIGTTNLHCDMADAVNVMCHASKTSDHAAAVWDIFPYESLMAIRTFVTKLAEERRKKIRDPIHDQWIYLNDVLLKRLEKEHGVKSWRIYQNPGDAVFIPAGCAHQVSNYHSAIKCAYDFVSPENVGRCLDITDQFGRVRREDALQLKNTLLFAWSNLY
ncbi:hypothetical protein BJV82DRAFT_565069, partial [Fennellomyces sp. T-0311]